MVSPDYFNTFGIAITQGRPFNERDIAGSVPVTIVNEAFVKKFLANLDPLKQRVSVEQIIPGVTKLGPAIEWQIVGVYRNIHNGGVRGDGFPEMNVPFDQSPWPQAGIAVRTGGDPASLTKSIAAVVANIDHDLPLDQVKTMDQLVDQSHIVEMERIQADSNRRQQVLQTAILRAHQNSAQAIAEIEKPLGAQRKAMQAVQWRLAKARLENGKFRSITFPRYMRRVAFGR